MQAVAQSHTEPFRLGITWEAVVYLVLTVLLMAFYTAELDTVAITPTEASGALAAYRSVYSADAADAITSPAVFWAQRIGFTVFGGTEFAARILTTLAGVGLALSPLLFRDVFGRTRTLVIAVILGLSPVLLLSARFSGGVVWAMLCAVIGLRLLLTYWQTRRSGVGVGAVVAFAALIFFSESGGAVLAITLALTAALATFYTSVEPANDEGAQGIAATVRSRLASFPLLPGLAVALGVGAAFTTGFLTYPQGLSGVGGSLSAFLTGLTQAPPDTPLFYPLRVSVFYELLLWGFGIAGIVLLVRRAAFTFVERLLVAWFGVAVVATMLYAGASAEHALWITVPLACLAAYTIALLFDTDESLLWMVEDEPDEDILRLYTPQWGKWLLAVIALGLVTMLVMQLQAVGRGFIMVENGRVDLLVEQLSTTNFELQRGGVFWLFFTALFMLIGFFLAASIWGTVTTLQALALGIAGFMLINGFSAGWSGAVTYADTPVEPWHPQAASPNVPWLRSTLVDLAERESQGYPELPITVVLDPANGVTGNGVLAWQLRDFEDVRYVDTLAGASGQEIVIAPSLSEEPDLGGSYVGQDFVILTDWNATTVQGGDFLAWWFLRQTRENPTPAQTVTLWVRQDIYDSEPFDPTAPVEAQPANG